MYYKMSIYNTSYLTYTDPLWTSGTISINEPSYLTTDYNWNTPSTTTTSTYSATIDTSKLYESIRENVRQEIRKEMRDALSIMKADLRARLRAELIKELTTEIVLFDANEKIDPTPDIDYERKYDSDNEQEETTDGLEGSTDEQPSTEQPSTEQPSTEQAKPKEVTEQAKPKEVTEQPSTEQPSTEQDKPKEVTDEPEFEWEQVVIEDIEDDDVPVEKSPDAVELYFDNDVHNRKTHN